MITKISIQNMKGQTTEQPLSGMDIFTGRNGAGKTTRVQALSYAMLGYVPGQKKTAADIFKMATGNSMNVGLDTESFQFSRNLKRTEGRNNKTGEVTASIKESISLSPGAGERTDSDKKQRIVNEMGNFSVMLDFGEFLAMSDTKRRDFIYSLSTIDGSSWDRTRLHKYLVADLLTNELQTNNPEQYKSMQEQIARAIKEYPVGFGISDGLQAMLDWSESEKKYWAAKQKDAQGAVRNISDQKNELEETERGIHERKKELIALENTLIFFEKQITEVTEKQKSIDKKKVRMTELAAGIAEIEKTPEIDTAEIDKQIETLKSKIRQVPDISADLKNLFESGKEVKKKISISQEQKNTLSGANATIQSTIQSLNEALKRVGEMEGRCIASPMIKCPKDFSDPKLVEGVEANRTAAAKKIAELKDQVARIDERIRELNNQEESISKQRADLEKSVSDANTENARINQEMAKLTAQKEALMKGILNRKNKLKLYKDELSKLTEEPTAQIEDIQDVRGKASDTRAKVTELKATIEQKEKARQALIIVQQSMLDNRQADYNAVALKLIHEKLGPKGAQGELVKEIISPICEDIEGNLRLMGFHQVPFFETESETGKEIFQFGWTNERSHRVNFDALSAGQQTVFLAAMMVTIIDRKQPKTRLLVMDNINHLDAQNFQLLIDGLSKIKDKLDNIILAGAIEFEFQADEWKVWNLSKSERGVEQNA